MNNISFGNLTVMVKNRENLASELHKKFKNEGLTVNTEHYYDEVKSVDGRLYGSRNANTITELRIKTGNDKQEKDVLQQLHDWAIHNKVNTRVDIDIDNNTTRRAQRVSHDEDNPF